MPLIEFPPDIDERLQRAVPVRLRGPRKTAQRVIHAVEAALRGERLEPLPSEPGSGETKPTPSAEVAR